MDLGLWNITHIPSGRIEFGHDPRYASFERLFFGRVREEALRHSVTTSMAGARHPDLEIRSVAQRDSVHLHPG
ncbi:hypothetical protein GUITHDRAFT_153464 [Guillardia theta CCMP2712]|uniref:Uncharacterized protein n=1 Tax=Guillardia theta (strain CCMP2712) TaxID=905079 RepID=L1J2Z3_GUITC|nr:hypothetical protein GUITHDRAFT_153464 [Guillardia theta CCMP2712]EKX42871.1 hypothetical protein GUITHDRAFT_153464 [Guillardia theta CCMP2712]|eukprot:XP_005829851.1 hypothetical protein GUITHDRAFT_153464 [Guillardia theta CCMP2712]